MPRTFNPRDPTHVSRTPPPPAAARAANVELHIGELIEADKVQLAIQRLGEALSAKVSMRAPRATGEPNNYLIADDWPTRLAAIKILLAYKFGNPADTLAMKLDLSKHAAGEAPPQTREEMLEQLRETGTDLREIVETWTNGMKVAEKAEPGAQIVTTTQKPGPLALVDI